MPNDAPNHAPGPRVSRRPTRPPQPFAPTPKINWSKIPHISVDGLDHRMQQKAEVLNKRIDLLAAFRRQADSGSSIGMFYSRETAHDEAMRREVKLRNDISKFNVAAQRPNDEENHAQMKESHMFLTRRGTHTGRRGC